MLHQVLLIKLGANPILLLHCCCVNSVALLIADSYQIGGHDWELHEYHELQILQ